MSPRPQLIKHRRGEKHRIPIKGVGRASLNLTFEKNQLSAPQKKGGKPKKIFIYFIISSGFIFLASSQLTLSGSRPDCFISIRAHTKRERTKKKSGWFHFRRRERATIWMPAHATTTSASPSRSNKNDLLPSAPVCLYHRKPHFFFF